MRRSGGAAVGRPAAWIYKGLIFLAAFTGMAQMPIMRRYYLADLPLMDWTADFSATSHLHYLAAAGLLAMLAWRLALGFRWGDRGWTWGPRTAWGVSLLAALAVTGAVKVVKNLGIFIDPTLMVVLDLAHLGSAMAFILTGLAVLLRPAPREIPAEAPGDGVDARA